MSVAVTIPAPAPSHRRDKEDDPLLDSRIGKFSLYICIVWFLTKLATNEAQNGSFFIAR
jgi:hypothetical protein